MAMSLASRSKVHNAQTESRMIGAADGRRPPGFASKPNSQSPFGGRADITKVLLLVIAYSGVIIAAHWVAYLIRFEFHPPLDQQRHFWRTLQWTLPLELVFLAVFGQFRSLLSYFSLPDARRVVYACASAGIVTTVVWYVSHGNYAPPRSIVLLGFILDTFGLIGVRVEIRMMRERHRRAGGAEKAPRRMVIVGAGDVGAHLVKEMLSRRDLGMTPVAFFDDDRSKWNKHVHGVPVLGRPELLTEEKIHADEAVIAMPSASGRRIREVVQVFNEAKLRFETVPSVEQMVNGTVKVSQIRPVEIEDLLGREQVQLETGRIRELVGGKVVMVTGAGGSIGSELCRQIAAFQPQCLLLVERCEVQMFQVEQELIGIGGGSRGRADALAGSKSLAGRGTFGGEAGGGSTDAEALAGEGRNGGRQSGGSASAMTVGPAKIVPLVADILDEERLRGIFERFHPQLVFHAAAHKHVPMMEHQPYEAFRNNTIGTKQLAKLAMEFGVERFVLISTDKAINPTNAMGATKRLAELYLQALQKEIREGRFGPEGGRRTAGAGGQPAAPKPLDESGQSEVRSQPSTVIGERAAAGPQHQLSTDRPLGPPSHSPDILGEANPRAAGFGDGNGNSSSGHPPRGRESEPAAPKLMAVRFGNVLGSSGSVIPTFRKQITAGGPVTVTHPEVTRYFMTVSEAVGLVLQSATLGEGGEIFVLDMGKLVKIVDVARQLIELSGLKPDVDIEIQFTGLRPGEKLFEEVNHQSENMVPTEHPKIMHFVGEPLPFETLRRGLVDIQERAAAMSPDQVKLEFRKLVPEYHPYLDAEAQR